MPLRARVCRKSDWRSASTWKGASKDLAYLSVFTSLAFCIQSLGASAGRLGNQWYNPKAVFVELFAISSSVP